MSHYFEPLAVFKRQAIKILRFFSVEKRHVYKSQSFFCLNRIYGCFPVFFCIEGKIDYIIFVMNCELSSNTMQTNARAITEKKNITHSWTATTRQRHSFVAFALLLFLWCNKRRQSSGKPESGIPEKGKPEKGKPEKGKPEKGKPESGKIIWSYIKLLSFI